MNRYSLNCVDDTQFNEYLFIGASFRTFCTVNPAVFLKEGVFFLKIYGDKIIFETCDSHFVAKFGLTEATDMVLNFLVHNRHPFIFDTYQLADFFKISRYELFTQVKNCDNSYTCHTIKKKNGGSRKIEAPDERLKFMQRRILDRILSVYPVSEYATAYRTGYNISNNASPHCGKKYLLKLDLYDFFGSITFYQVYNNVFNTKYFSLQTGAMLTKLCCRNEHLPQGASTSPAISNIVMRGFDNVMGLWCRERNISYTRYCDDITFSANEPLYIAYTKACSLLEEAGFVPNPKKTHFITNASRQTVTGLTVNEKVSVCSAYKRQLRQEIYYALKKGVADSIMFSGKKEFIINGEPDCNRYIMHLAGKIRYILQIEPENAYFKKALSDLKEFFSV